MNDNLMSRSEAAAMTLLVAGALLLFVALIAGLVLAGVVIAAVTAVGWVPVLWLGHRRDQRRRTERGPVRPGDLDEALALVCDPHPMCGAEDTGIAAWTPAELAFLAGLRKEPM